MALDRERGPWLDPDDDRYRFIPGDVRETSYLNDNIKSDVDVIFHLAAVVGVSNYLRSPFAVMDVNVFGTRNVLMTALSSGARLVLASTSEIYGRNPKVPWVEDDDRVLGSTSVDRWSYSTSKAAAEHLAIAAHRQDGLPVSIVRYFNAYGPRQAPNYVIPRAVHRVLNGRRPIVYDGGSQTRCFTFIDDIVRGTLLAAESRDAIGETFNLGSPVESTVLEVTKVVLDAAGSDLVPEDFSTSEYGQAYQDIVRRVPDSTKAGRLLGWGITVDLAEGVGRMVQWAEDNQSWLDLPDPIDASAPTTTLS